MAANAAHKKILQELDAMAKKVTRHLNRFNLHLAGETLYHYFWHTFADKTIEAIKPRLRLDRPEQSEGSHNSQDRQAAQYVLLTCLTTSLKLLHPFMPFVTETVWQQIPKEKESMLITEQWPY